MKNKFNIGDIVKSNYSARWVGIVLDYDLIKSSYGTETIVYMVKPVLTSDSRLQRKVKPRVLGEGWLEKSHLSKFDIIDKICIDSYNRIKAKIISRIF